MRLPGIPSYLCEDLVYLIVTCLGLLYIGLCRAKPSVSKVTYDEAAGGVYTTMMS
jgi:hypothetical protein